MLESRAQSPPRWGRWTLVCGAAEAVGLAVAATAAGVLVAVAGEPHDWPSGLAVWLGSVGGGAVEGLAVGALQWAVLRSWLPRLRAARWVGVTVTVAMVGWALGMAPSALWLWQMDGGPTDAPVTGPPGWLLALGGTALGGVLGVVFGAAQATALGGQVAHPQRWVLANGLGWAFAMALIMVGASLPSGPWPLPELLALGAVTGVLAGLAIGAVTGLFLPSLDDRAPRATRRVNRLVLWLLRSPAHRVLSGSLVDLRYTGAWTGRRYALPVQYAATEGRLVVCPGDASAKVWWRSLAAAPEVEVNWRGAVLCGRARVLYPNGSSYAAALTTYRARWPRVRPDGPLVVIDLR